jgi:molecular chaperone GrpE
MTTKNTKENTENDIENEIKKINNKDDNENFREKDSTDELYEEVNPESDEGEGEKNVSNTNENFQAEIESLRDEKLRLLAEMENLRKRADRERVDLIRYGSINLARDILSPDDNLTRALGAIIEDEKNSPTIKNLVNGLQMVQKEFSSILEKHGIKKIKALNENFDHNLHQAMLEIEDDKTEPGIVVQEMQSGYTMHDRLLRPSMVGVSKKPLSDKKTRE